MTETSTQATSQDTTVGEKLSDAAALENWMKELPMDPEIIEKYHRLFLQHEVGWAQIANITAQDLTDLGITKIGTRKAILEGIDELKTPQGITPYEEIITSDGFTPVPVPGLTTGQQRLEAALQVLQEEYMINKQEHDTLITIQDAVEKQSRLRKKKCGGCEVWFEKDMFPPGNWYRPIRIRMHRACRTKKINESRRERHKNLQTTNSAMETTTLPSSTSSTDTKLAISTTSDGANPFELNPVGLVTLREAVELLQHESSPLTPEHLTQIEGIRNTIVNHLAIPDRPCGVCHQIFNRYAFTLDMWYDDNDTTRTCKNCLRIQTVARLRKAREVRLAGKYKKENGADDGGDRGWRGRGRGRGRGQGRGRGRGGGGGGGRGKRKDWD